MVKFAYLRVVHPRAYTVRAAAGGSPAPAVPRSSNAVHPAASSHIFCWLRGLPKPTAAEVASLAQPRMSTSTAGVSGTGELSVAQLVSALNQRDQKRRIAAIYTLAAIGQPAVDSLLADLSEHSRRPRLLMQGDSGALVTDGDEGQEQLQNTVIWSENAVVCEDAAYALAAMEPSGELITAVSAAIASQRPDLLEHEWMILNCVFVMGEMGTAVLDRCVALCLVLFATVRLAYSNTLTVAPRGTHPEIRSPFCRQRWNICWLTS